MKTLIILLVQYVLGLLNLRKEEECEEEYCPLPETQVKHYTRDELLGLMDFSSYPAPKTETESDGPSLLIVDDIVDTMFLLKATRNQILRDTGKDYFKDFKISWLTSETCGFAAHKYITTPGIKVDYAIIDITIGSRFLIEGADILELDGIDIADELKRYNPDIKFIFFTAHTLDEDNKKMVNYYKKCRALLGVELNSCYTKKNDDRNDAIKKLLYGV